MLSCCCKATESKNHQNILDTTRSIWVLVKQVDYIYIYIRTHLLHVAIYIEISDHQIYCPIVCQNQTCSVYMRSRCRYWPVFQSMLVR